MATYYAITGGGNWNVAGTWNTASNQATGNAGAAPTSTDDCILDAFSGNVTVAATSSGKSLTCTGYTGTLTISSTLTISGNITLVSGMTLAGSSGITVNAASTITSGGISGANFTWTGGLTLSTGNKTFNTNGTTWPQISVSIAMTITLSSDLQATLLYIANATTTFAGAFNLSCDTWVWGSVASGAVSVTLVSGQTLSVATAIRMVSALDRIGSNTCTLKSSTASSPVTLTYSGTAANCLVAGIAMTDIDASTSAQVIDNWNGGTLTRTTNITNRTSADIGGGSSGRPELRGSNL